MDDSTLGAGKTESVEQVAKNAGRNDHRTLIADPLSEFLVTYVLSSASFRLLRKQAYRGAH